MVQGGQHLGLALKAGETVIVGDGRQQHLHRDVAAELGIGRAIHLSHAAWPSLAVMR